MWRHRRAAQQAQPQRGGDGAETVLQKEDPRPTAHPAQRCVCVLPFPSQTHTQTHTYMCISVTSSALVLHHNHAPTHVTSHSTQQRFITFMRYKLVDSKCSDTDGENQGNFNAMQKVNLWTVKRPPCEGSLAGGGAAVQRITGDFFSLRSQLILRLFIEILKSH